MPTFGEVEGVGVILILYIYWPGLNFILRRKTNFGKVAGILPNFHFQTKRENVNLVSTVK